MELRVGPDGDCCTARRLAEPKCRCHGQRGRAAFGRSAGFSGHRWIAGDFIYLLTERSQLVCLVRKDGRTRWVTQMPLTVDPDDSASDPLTWRDPVLAGERLYLTSSGGDLVTLSPYDGAQIDRLALPASAAASPIVALGTVFILTEEAELLAYR